MGRKDTFNVKQLRKAIKLSENPTFQNNFRKFSKLFTKNRLKKIGNKNKRLFTERERLMALSLYKKDSHAYGLLSKMFVLTPQRELQKLTSKLYNKSGINKRICDKLKSKTVKLSRMEKMCVLLFDEVIIRPSFDQKRSVVIRDKNIDKSQIADHAIIFMIRLIFKKTKQPIAYKFSFGKITRNKLKILIENIILDLQACGLKVLATVCDHNTRNIGAITKLIEETQEKHLGMNTNKYPHRTFEVNSQEIVPLFDAPHLMKGLRNDLITKNLKCTLEGTERVAKWEHFVQFEKICATVFADLGWHCLSKRHVDPKKMNIIDPDIAIQTFYDKNGRFMGGMSGRSYNDDQDTIAAEAADTAHITMFIDKLYKSMSGSYKERNQDEPLLAQVNPTKQVHEKVWNNSKLVFTSMKFIAEDGKEVSTNSIKAWIITLDNIKYLSRVLYVKYHMTQFWMARFNMDPLMMLIRRLQKYGCRNINTFEIK